MFASNTSNPLQSTNILALDTMLAVISSLSTYEQPLPHSNSLTNSLSSSGHHDTTSLLNDSVGLIFSSTKGDRDDQISGEKLQNGVCRSEPDLLLYNSDNNISDGDEPSAGSSSELLKSRQSKKVHLIMNTLV